MAQPRALKDGRLLTRQNILDGGSVNLHLFTYKYLLNWGLGSFGGRNHERNGAEKPTFVLTFGKDPKDPILLIHGGSVLRIVGTMSDNKISGLPESLMFSYYSYIALKEFSKILKCLATLIDFRKMSPFQDQFSWFDFPLNSV